MSTYGTRKRWRRTRAPGVITAATFWAGSFVFANAPVLTDPTRDAQLDARQVQPSENHSPRLPVSEPARQPKRSDDTPTDAASGVTVPRSVSAGPRLQWLQQDPQVGQGEAADAGRDDPPGVPVYKNEASGPLAKFTTAAGEFLADDLQLDPNEACEIVYYSVRVHTDAGGICIVEVTLHDCNPCIDGCDVPIAGSYMEFEFLAAEPSGYKDLEGFFDESPLPIAGGTVWMKVESDCGTYSWVIAGDTIDAGDLGDTEDYCAWEGFDECVSPLVNFGGFHDGFWASIRCAAPGACCLSDNTTCMETTQSDCEDVQGGVYQGDDTECADSQEACCLADHTCEMADPLCCVQELGGISQGPGSQCGGEEACCDAAGLCYMADETCCQANGDTPQGPGSTCGGWRACCLPLPDGTCTMADAQCCASELAGWPQGAADTCPGTTIACCLPDLVCVDTEELCCDDLDGSPSEEPACLGDNNSNGVDDACDCFIAAGQDCFVTLKREFVVDFRDNPIPRGAFNLDGRPPSLPFDGVVKLTGVGGLETTIERLDDLDCTGPVPATTRIQIDPVDKMKLTGNIAVSREGRPAAEPWTMTANFHVGPMGEMRVTKTHENGGTFTAEFSGLVRFLFVPMSVGAARQSPQPIAFFPPYVPYEPPLEYHFETVGQYPWVHELSGGTTANPCGDDFIPGVEGGVGDQCCKKILLAGPEWLSSGSRPTALRCAPTVRAALRPITPAQ